MSQIQRSMLAALVFVLVALGAISIATWDKKTRLADEDRKENEKKPFAEWKTEDITEVELKHNGATVLAEKLGPSWHITAPMDTAGDDAALEGVASAVVNLMFKNILKDGEMEPRVVDLVSPGTQATVKAKDGKSAHVWIGKRNSFDESLYVRAGEDPSKAPVATAQQIMLDPFMKTLFDLREKRLVTINTADVDGVKVVPAEGVPAAAFQATRVMKDGKKQWDDPWRLTSPVDGVADREEINKLLQSMGSARALAFVDEEGTALSSWGLDKPRFTVTITGAGKTTTVLLGNSQKGAALKHYMKRADAPNVAEITETVELGLLKDLLAWRDKRVLDFDRDAVKVITTTLADGTNLRLEKAAGSDGAAEAWKVASPKEGPAKGWKTSSLLYALNTFKVSRFVKEGGITPEVMEHHGLKTPSRMVTLLGVDGKELATLLLGREEGGQVYVMAKGGSFVGAVDKGRLEELPKNVDDYLQPDKDEAGDDG